MKKICAILLLIVTVLNMVQNAAFADAKATLEEYLIAHPEYKWAKFLDLNGDGEDELIVAESQFGSGLLYLTLCALSDDGSDINRYRLSTYASFIKYDPEYHALIADAGSDNSYSMILMTYDEGKMHIEEITGYNTGTRKEYASIITFWMPDSADNHQGESFQESFRYMTEQEYQEFFKRFDTLPALMLDERESIISSKEVLRNHTDWSRLEAYKEDLDDGLIRFSIQLTPEQVSDYDHASLLMLQQEREKDSEEYQCIFEYTDVDLDENGVLSLSCKPKAFYMLDEKESIIEGPLSCIAFGDGRVVFAANYLNGPSILQSSDKLSLFYYYRLYNSWNLIPLEVHAGDSGVIYETDKLLLENHDFSKVLFWTPVYKCTRDDDGSMLDFNSWTNNGMSGKYIDLPVNWHMETRNYQDDGYTVKATFQIADKEGNIHSSNLVGVFEEDRQKQLEKAFQYLEEQTDWGARRAFGLFMDAAQNNEPRAMGQLAYMLRNGIGTEQDDQAAFYWANRGEEMGDPRSIWELGYAFLEGRGTDTSEENYKMAFELFERAGNTDDETIRGLSYNDLGYMYDNGLYVDESDEIAVKWYRKAADLNNPYAMFNLGLCYLDGSGVSKNYDQALDWFSRAADQGEEYNKEMGVNNMIWRVGYELFNSGLSYGGNKIDWKTGAIWIRKAAALGSKQAQDFLDVNQASFPE